MDAINRISPPATAPETLKPPAAAAAPEVAPQTPLENDTGSVDVVLSQQAQQFQEKQTTERADKTDKKTEEKKTPPPPSLGEIFYKQDQIEAEKSKIAREKAANQIEERWSNYFQYTNNYLAQLAYAKTLADQPVILPQPADTQDLIAKLNLFT